MRPTVSGAFRLQAARASRRLAAPILAWLAPGQGAAQEAACRLHGVGDYSHSVRVSGSDHYTHYGSGGVDYRCTDGVRIEADSAVLFEAANQVHLFGRVRFEDQGSALSADSAFYFGADKQLRAWGNVSVEDRVSGALVTGQALNYFRESAVREVDRMDVYDGDPHATLRSRPSSAAPADSETAVRLDSAEAESSAPYEIDAGHFVLEGRRVFRARDSVVVIRDSLRTSGDSLVYDMERGLMTITGNARATQRDFVLAARSLTAEHDGSNDVVLARGDAELVGENMRMNAPAIRVFLADGAAGRLVALRRIPPEDDPADGMAGVVGLSPGDQARLRDLLQEEADIAPQEGETPAQPSISTSRFNLWADSVEVVAPAQVLDVVAAVGNARAETFANKAATEWDAPEIAAKDWMRGDTIVARFAPGEATNGAAQSQPPPARLETLTASGTATSFYRLAPSDTLESAKTGEAREVAVQPALHYVAGDKITVLFEAGEVVQMDVEGQTLGYHLEPTPPLADTAVAGTGETTEPDTAVVRPASSAPTLSERPATRRNLSVRPRNRPWT